MTEFVAGRAYPRVYRTSGKKDVLDFLTDAVTRSGGTLVHSTSHTRAPVYMTADSGSGERIGMMIFPFRSTTVDTRNRPDDEARTQIRLGGEESWNIEHEVPFDPARVDITMVLGCHLEADLFIGLDPIAYDPLPMGASSWVKVSDLKKATKSGWHVITKETAPGTKREKARADGLETIVVFRPERLLDYAHLDRRAIDLGLDPPLRYKAAQALEMSAGGDAGTMHRLEKQFGLTGAEILDIIVGRNRLNVAVRGGVAEYHLQKLLENDPNVKTLKRLDQDGEPDFEVEFKDGRKVRIECKNASPDKYANGDGKVEVQKTRASKGDPASRFYEITHFDIVAACVFASSGKWNFLFRRTSDLQKHADYPERLAAIQRVNGEWSNDPFVL